MSDGIHTHDYSTGNEPPEVPQWDTRRLQEDYEVLGFQAPYVVVRRKSDGVKGSLEFKDSPRVYFNFQAVE